MLRFAYFPGLFHAGFQGFAHGNRVDFLAAQQPGQLEDHHKADQEIERVDIHRQGNAHAVIQRLPQAADGGQDEGYPKQVSNHDHGVPANHIFAPLGMQHTLSVVTLQEGIRYQSTLR